MKIDLFAIYALWHLKTITNSIGFFFKFDNTMKKIVCTFSQ